MGFLKNAFKRKPGGTALGNTIRGVLKTASAGLLGNGALMISEEEYAKKNGTPYTPQPMSPITSLVIDSAANTPQGQALIAEQKKKAIIDMLTKYWYVAAGIVAGIVYLIKKK